MQTNLLIKEQVLTPVCSLSQDKAYFLPKLVVCNSTSTFSVVAMVQIAEIVLVKTTKQAMLHSNCKDWHEIDSTVTQQEIVLHINWVISS